MKITQEGINEVMRKRNEVLAALGFEADDSVIEAPETTEANGIVSERYGKLIETEIAPDVIEVEWEREDLYVRDLRHNPEIFVGA